MALGYCDFALSGARVVIQGFGAVGKHAARFLAARGAVLVGAADSGGTLYQPQGLDVAALIALKDAGGKVCDFPQGQKLERDAVIGLECEILEEQRVRVIVDFTSQREAWQRLGDGYRVEAVFVVWEGADVLQVPTNALFRHNSGWAAFVVQDGRAWLRALQIGQRTGLRAQVLAGIKAGEQVVTHPDDKIRDGARVKARGTGGH